MKLREDQFIKNLVAQDESDYKEQSRNENILQKLTQEEPLGSSSPEFINHPALYAFISSLYGDEQNYFMLWLGIEDYFNNKNNPDLAQEKLSQIEEALKKCLEKVTPQAKARGVAMLPVEIANKQFMRSLYSLNDDKISALFLKYLPAPRATLFEAKALPEIIFKEKQESTKALLNFLERNENKLDSVSSKIVKVQRRFRAKEQKRENIERLAHRYERLWKNQNEPKNTPETKATAEEISAGEKIAKKIMANANKPYIPKCEKRLAKRIMLASEKIELFSTVSHLTAATALESIFNDGLYGRRSMLQFYMPFRPASLWQTDIEEGDANVVCLGANAIDPKAKHGIELQFDAKKIAENNPCTFYKQRDLGFDPEKRRSVRIGDLNLRFSHTGTYRNQPSDVSSLVLFKADGSQYAWSAVKKAILIANNMKQMHQILTLNFFRFVDQLKNSNCAEDSLNKNRIYSALNNLNDEELVEVLREIGEKMTDTMEFNFYGAYQIDFSALLTIKNDNPSYTLTLPSFIDELKAGKLEIFKEVMVKLPEIFNSYRFIDYLLTTTNNQSVIAELQQQRGKCTLPAWMEKPDENFKPNL